MILCAVFVSKVDGTDKNVNVVFRQAVEDI